MQWEQLTQGEFGKAVKDTGLCVVPMGVLERHGEHLPLGTDFINAHAVAALAARREPAVVFPPFYFGQINEARHFSGTVAIGPRLLGDLLWAACDEIGRNGFNKILIYNGHGGNNAWLRFFVQGALHRRRPYTLYLCNRLARSDLQAEINKICPTGGGHAHEEETCLTLAVAPKLVKMDAVPAEPAEPLGRLRHLHAFTAIGWYADYPEHYSGDARDANAEKGQKVLEILVGALAELIREVKNDEAAPRLEREFFERAGEP